jgi:hypothetical protein
LDGLFSFFVVVVLWHDPPIAKLLLPKLIHGLFHKDIAGYLFPEGEF